MTSHHIHLPHRLAGLLCLLAAAWAGPALAQSRALQAMDFVALDGDRVLFTFTLSEAAPEPVVFTIDRPARLSMDLPDTRLALTERYKRVNVGKARAIAAAESKDRTRVVVELAELTAHSVQVEGNKVFLTLEGTGTAAPIPLTIVPSSAAASPAVPVAAAIRNVDFRRGDSGEGRVVVTLTDPRSAVDVREEGGKVIAEFKDTTVAENLLRRLDVLDFATPVKFIDTLRDGVDTRIVVTPAAGSEFEQVAYQAGELFTLELQPISAEQRAERRRTDPQYTGERISLSFQNVDVRSLLQIIADVAGVNMVVSDSVRGDIAMRLQNVPWDQALDIILRTKGLGMRQQGNVMLVAPLSEFAERDRALAEADKQNQVSAPLRSEIIQINYARAAEISALLRSGENSFLSERGRVSVDDRTNTLLVLETRDKLTEIRNLIARLDIPVRQVLIESRIVVATSDYTKELGARFGVQHINTLNDATVVTSGNLEDAATLNNNVVDFGLGNAETVVFPDSLNVSLPATNIAGSLAFLILGSDYGLDLELSALQLEGRGEIISTPRVITANSKEATIKQGFEVPYVTPSTGNSPATVSFKEALLSLTVNPQITPDNSIIMDLNVTRNEPDFSRAVQGNPPLNKREVKTQVRVLHGETLVLGGVYEQTNNNSTTKVPFLGDIPLIGVAFRNTIDTDTKRELLIFVTPKIIEEGLRVD